MGIFKKTVKYSKPSIEIDSKIENLNEGLNKTKLISSEQKFSEEEVNEILSEEVVDIENWREIFDEETVSEYEQQIDEVRERHNDLISVQGSLEYVKNKEVKEIFTELYQGEVERVVDMYVSKYSNDIINLREDLFHEIKKKPVVDLRVLEEKINLLTLKYNQLSEGLLNEPSTGLEDPVTFEQLKNHYQLLVGRLQEQLSTLGGGGEVRLQYLDDIVGIATNAAAYDGKFLKYNHSLKKFEFVTVSGGGGGISLTDLSVTTNSAGTAAFSYNNSNGVFTYTPPSFVGYATEGYVNSAVAGVSTFSGNYNDLTNKPTNVSDFTNDAGFITTSFTNTSQLTNDAGFISNNVSGVLTATSVDVGNNGLNVSGMCSFTGLTTITGDLYASGIVTANYFYANGGLYGSSLQIGYPLDVAGSALNAQVYLDNTSGDLQFGAKGTGSGRGDFVFYQKRGLGDKIRLVTIYSDTGNMYVAGTLSVPNGITAPLHNFSDNSKKLETTGYGVTVYGGVNASGIVTATSFSGIGSNLTGLTGASAGTYGDATNSSQITVDANGRITGITQTGISSLSSRGSLSQSTGSIGAGTTTNITITGHKSYMLQKISTSHAAWIRLYTDTTSRTADESREHTTDPLPGSGVIAEVRTTTSGISTFIMSPGVMGWNNDSTPGNNIYARVTNNESGSSDITVTLTALQLES